MTQKTCEHIDAKTMLQRQQRVLREYLVAYHWSLFGLDDHRNFHILLSMLQWMVPIGKPKPYQLV